MSENRSDLSNRSNLLKGNGECRAYLKTGEELLAEYGSSSRGLASEDASARLERCGRNKLEEPPKDSNLKKFFSQLKDPMIIVLLAAAVLSLVTSLYGGEAVTDVFIILFVVILNSVLGVVQESKAEEAIEALKKMTAATSKVMRDGAIQTVKSEELVPGDIILLEAGDAVPADARALESASLKVEESALTGESLPVDKHSEPLSAEGGEDIPLADRRNMIYTGSAVVYGRGKALVVATGMDTEVGKIAEAIAQAESGLTPLQLKLASLSKILTLIVVGICAAVFGFGIYEAGGFTVDGAIDSFMLAVSLAVAAIPEGLVAVVTIVLSIGVTKMSARNAVIRKLTAVETLGCAQIICSDKTGTLTQNRMTVVDRTGIDGRFLAAGLALASDAEVVYDGAGEGAEAVGEASGEALGTPEDADGRCEKSGNESGSASGANVTGEPTEAALVRYALDLGIDKCELIKQLPRIGEIPFDSGRKMMTTVHATESGIDIDLSAAEVASRAFIEGAKYIQFTKGAPNAVLDRCSMILGTDGPEPMDDRMKESVIAQNCEMAGRALRVLALAVRAHDEHPSDLSSKALENDMVFVGLVGMIDPIRPEVKAAVDECRSAGIRPIMITGDQLDTAVAIARDLGILEDAGEAIQGSALDDWTDEQLAANIGTYSVYARVRPEHKVRIVKAWKANGMVTAMTGDGVNDAPAIKSADIGIGMGITGTDVAKNVADMILADDNFATIVAAVEEGRKVYANIRKAIQFLLSSNVSELISIFAATLMGFVILKPAHILWINLITDSLPALALGLEHAERDSMLRKPRSKSDGIFAGGMGADIFYQGIFISILTLAAYFVGHFMENGVWEIAQSRDGMTMAFLTMSMTEIFHSFNMRSRRGSIFALHKRNIWMWGSALIALGLTTAVVMIRPVADVFAFTEISFAEYAVAIGLAALIIPLVELVKFLCGHREKAAR